MNRITSWRRNRIACAFAFHCSVLLSAVALTHAKAAPAPADSTVILSEFLAANVTGLRDNDGDSSDWIEIFNRGTQTADLDGWFLTDDPANLTKWRLPAVTVSAGAYLVIFASGKDRAGASAALHTNFRLARSGEYLGLVNAATNVVSEFAPAYPPQQPDVSYGRDRVYVTSTGFYPNPTPGTPNTGSGSGIAPAVTFSVPSGTFLQPFALSLSSPAPGAEIRYEIVDSGATASNSPSATSPLYTGPITVSNSITIRARTFAVTQLPGPLQSASYVRLQTNLAGFSSDLPVILLHTFGSRAIPYGVGFAPSNHTPGFMAVYEPRGGRSSLTNPPAMTARVGLNVHGAATAAYPKSSFNLESWDEFNQDKDISLLGMPPESDWLFYAPNNFEPVLIHFPLINELSRQAGRYAPRTRLVEVFVSTNTPGGVIGMSQYNGVYVVLEKIKRNPARVPLDRLDPQDTNAPAITGGYLTKLERTEVHERTMTVLPAGSIPGMFPVYQDPEGLEILRPEREPQRRYLSNYFAAATISLAGAEFANPSTGYARYLDPDSWIDHHLLNVLAFNVDAFRLGSFLSKPRDRLNERGEIVALGRLQMATIYDFDRALGSTDGRDFNPRVWRSTSGDLGTDFFHYWWYDRLFRDPDFWQRWIDRWQELRHSALSLGNITGLIDSLRNQLREAQPREQARWGTLAPPRSGFVGGSGFTYNFGAGSYDGEIAFLKHWLSNRVDFIDTNFVSRPRMEITGNAASGFTVQLTHAAPLSAGSVLYYTLDGTDPRQPGGALASGAQVYNGPISVTANARVIARTRNLNHRNLTGTSAPPLSSPWSGPVAETLVVTPPSLRITELMYHPSGDPQRPLQFEYLELRNIGPTLNLRGFRLRGAVEFTFPEQVLENGQYVLVVGDQAGFAARYGTPAPVAGQYQTALDNNRGQIVLEGPLGEPIHDFTYSSEWHPVTAGLGFSLVIVSEFQPLREFEEGSIIDNWDDRGNWRPSTAVGGSPGTGDPSRPNLPQVVINEILPRPEPDQTRFIELYNYLGPDADLSGWFITDDLYAPGKFRIRDGTTLPVFGYLALGESDLIPPPGTAGGLPLDPAGGELFLLSADAGGHLTGYLHRFLARPTSLGLSIGRHLSWGAGEEFVTQTSSTPGSANAGPRVGPVVISEIHYHPVDFGGGATGARTDNTDDEFIELRNITDNAVPLSGSAPPFGGWRIGGGVSFEFPPGITLPPGGDALVVRFDPVSDPGRLAAWRSKYGLTDETPVFGPVTGALDNTGALVELLSPERIDYSATRHDVVYARIDHVEYQAEDPWPAGAHGVGPSLSRITESGYGNDPANWVAAWPSPGSSYATGGALPSITVQPQTQSRVAYQSVTFHVSATGPGPLSYQWRFNRQPLLGETGATLEIAVAEPARAGIYDVVVLNPSGSIVSAPAALVLRIPIRFTVQPADQSRRPGESAFFAVAVESTAPPVRYQWLHDSSPIPHATNSTYTIASASPMDRGFYVCAATDGVSATNSAPARLTVLVPPLIVQQPVGQTAVRGQPIVLSVQVADIASQPLGYRWRRNGSTTSFQHLESAASYLLVTNLPPGSSFNFDVVVTNAAHTLAILSSNAVVTILADTDGDGLPDEFETSHGLDPSNAADARIDTDGDTMTNADEYIAGTNPGDRLSYLKVDRVSFPGRVQLEFIAVAARTYSVLSTESLGSGLWSTVANVAAPSTTRSVTVTHNHPGGTRYYRLVTPAQPAPH